MILLSAATHLRTQITSLLAFYDPIARDDIAGGYNNQLRDDGTIYDKSTKHVVGTCRFAVNYAIAARLFPEKSAAYKDMCAHGIKFLQEKHVAEWAKLLLLLERHCKEAGLCGRSRL